MASYRARFLQIQRASERALAQLFRDLAAGIAADVARRADADGVVPRIVTFELQAQSAERIRKLYLGRNRAGELAPFDVTAEGKVIPLAPYPQALWAAISAAVRLPVEENAAILTKRLPADVLDVMRRARVDPFKAVGAKVAEVEVFRPNPLATYAAPHTWVDPNGYRLSDRIWNVAAAERSRLDAYLDDSIKRGTGALTMAKELEQFLDPSRKTLTTNKPYGSKASYDAMRLARSEITQAHYKADMAASAMNPFVEGMGWMLSASHPRRDICDDYARGGPEGDGVYPLGEVPSVPHPQCLCWRKKVLRKDPDAVITSLRDDIRKARADLVDKIGPVEVENFDRLLLGETLPPIVAQPAPSVGRVAAPVTVTAEPSLLQAPVRSPLIELQFTADTEQLAAVEKMQNAALNRLAPRFGTTPEEMGRIADETFRRLVGGKEIAIQVKSEHLDAIIESGRYKTQFETSISGGANNKAYRAEAEAKGLGAPSDLGPKQRPVYGFLNLGDKARKQVKNYGDLTFIIKDDVRRRSTVTMDDSLSNFDSRRVAGTPLNDPKRVGWDGYMIDLYEVGTGKKTVDDMLDTVPYIEVQIQGGIKLDDISAVIDKDGRLLASQRRALAARGIQVIDGNALQASMSTAERVAKAEAEYRAKQAKEAAAKATKAAKTASAASPPAPTPTVRPALTPAPAIAPPTPTVASTQRAAGLFPGPEGTPAAVAFHDRLQKINADTRAEIRRIADRVAQVSIERQQASKELLAYSAANPRATPASDNIMAAINERYKAAKAQADALSQQEQALKEREADALSLIIADRGTTAKVQIQASAKLTGTHAEGTAIIKQLSPIDVDFEYTIDPRSTRSSTSVDGKKIKMEANTDLAYVLHEFGHVLDTKVDPYGVPYLDRSRAFYAARTAGDTLERMSSTSHPDEVTKVDRWKDRYMGRYYVDPRSGQQYGAELIAMGIEEMRRDPLAFYAADKQHFAFIYEILMGR